MRRSPRIVQAFVLTLAVGLSLTACGDKKPTSAAGDGGTKTSAPAAAKLLTQSDFSDRVFSALEKAGSAKVHFESGAGGQTMSGDGEIKYGDDLAVRITMKPPKGTTGPAPQEMLLIGKNLYINMGGKYMTMPIDAFKSMGVPDLTANLDPKIQAKAFKLAVTKFEKAGAPVTLDGVQATPYDVTIDPSKAPDVYGTALTQPINVVYYIGPDDLLRKMVYKDKNGDFVATYSDWGAPVTIEPPAASQVMSGMG